MAVSRSAVRERATCRSRRLWAATNLAHASSFVGASVASINRESSKGRTADIDAPAPVPAMGAPELGAEWPVTAKLHVGPLRATATPFPGASSRRDSYLMKTAARTHTFTESVIRGMTRLANEHGAINLAQGFPNFSAPDPLKDAAARAIRDDINQYAITWGAKRLRDALARKYAEWYGMAVNPETEITVTCGATEAMASALLAIVDPGDEVIVFEPFYENYGPDAILCGAKPVYVPLATAGELDLERLAAAFSAHTRAIIVCTPNNPTGRVLSRGELEAIAELCRRHDAYA